MAKLVGKKVDDVLVEVLGPITGRNYNTSGAAAPVAPEVTVSMAGAGSVQLQSTTVSVRRGNPGPNTFTTDLIPSPDAGDWSNLGAAVTAGSPVTVAVAPDTSFVALRVVVATEGDGKAFLDTQWN